MRLPSCFAVLLSACALPMQAQSGLSDWKPLFDGETLSGWVQRGGKAKYQVEDGAIVGSTVPGTPNSFLCTERDYAHFILEFEVKVDPRLNSGVQIRSESRPDYKNGQVHGYQVEIDPSPRAWSGGIYDEGRRGWLADLKESPKARTAFRNGEWNRYRVEAIGDSIRTWVNDIPAASLRDDLVTTGFIALQVHSTTSTEPLEVRWRNIRLREADPARLKVRTPDPRMGDWQGELSPASTPLAAQILSLGNGQYLANLLPAFDSRAEKLGVLDGTERGAEVLFAGGDWEARLVGERLTGKRKSDGATFELKRVERPSPTLGQAPPEGAVVLFNGSDLNEWITVKDRPAAWTLTGDGAMEVTPGGNSLKTKQNLGDGVYHIEFRSPFMPNERGQKRGNSGVYVNGIYEVQILDSYGLEGLENECGGIYKAAAPRVNMCAPPGQWQTYDIDFRGPKFDAQGNKTANARITVRHNGVVIHENLELPSATPGGVAKEERPGPGPLMLQDHGDPVQFRNIWFRPAEAR